MASVIKFDSTIEKQFLCAICRGSYVIPRYLPTCGHTFCERCLLDFVTNIKERGELGSQFACPECRTPYDVPENKALTLEWIQTLPVNTAIGKIMDLELPPGLNKDEKHLCKPCGRRGETNNNGQYFCLDCREILCDACKEYHNSFKTNLDHATVDFKVFSSKALHADFLDNFMKCPEHPDRDMDFYSENTEELLCGLCAQASDKTHTDTIMLTCIDTNMDKVKNDTVELKRQMEAVNEHLQLLQNLRKRNTNDLKHQLKQLKDQMEQMREQVVAQMDNIVQHFASLAKAIETEVEAKSDEDSTRVLEIMKQLKEDQSFLDIVNEHGYDKHMFICTAILLKHLEDAENKTSLEDQCLEQYEATMKVAEDLTKLINVVDRHNLVKLNMTVHKSDHKYHESCTNVLKEKQLVKIGEHTTRPLQGGCSPTYRGISVHTDGTIMLCDTCDGHFCMYNASDGRLLTFKRNDPFSAAPTGKFLVAVSVPGDKAIYIIDAKRELVVDKTFNTPYQPKSLVAIRNGRLAVAWNDPPAFGIINISGTDIVQETYFNQDTEGRKFQSFEYFAVNEKKSHVIQTCASNQAVYCFDLTGKPVFKYTDSDLTNPQGVALDRCGNIYVCDYGQSSIHKLSSDGQKISIIKEGIPTHPLAICCNKSDGTFWITQHTDGRFDILTVCKLD